MQNVSYLPAYIYQALGQIMKFPDDLCLILSLYQGLEQYIQARNMELDYPCIQVPVAQCSSRLAERPSSLVCNKDFSQLLDTSVHTTCGVKKL